MQKRERSDTKREPKTIERVPYHNARIGFQYHFRSDRLIVDDYARFACLHVEQVSRDDSELLG